MSMTETIPGSIDPEKLNLLNDRVRSLLGKKRSVEFRGDDGNAVGLSRGGRTIGITLLDRTPFPDSKGDELYPYTELTVVSRKLHGLGTVEKIGVMARDTHGILVPWEGGRKAPKQERRTINEQMKRKNFKPDHQPELKQYSEAVKVLLDNIHDNSGRMHDRYGRTPEEKTGEENILIEFPLQMARLMDRARSRREIKNSITFSSVDLLYRSLVIPVDRDIAVFPLETGAELSVVKEKSRLSGFTETFVDIFHERIGASIQFKVRSSDRRLGVSETKDGNKKNDNPVSADVGQGLIDILRSIN